MKLPAAYLENRNAPHNPSVFSGGHFRKRLGGFHGKGLNFFLQSCIITAAAAVSAGIGGKNPIKRREQ